MVKDIEPKRKNANASPSASFAGSKRLAKVMHTLRLSLCYHTFLFLTWNSDRHRNGQAYKQELETRFIKWHDSSYPALIKCESSSSNSYKIGEITLLWSLPVTPLCSFIKTWEILKFFSREKVKLMLRFFQQTLDMFMHVTKMPWVLTVQVSWL